MAIAKKTTKSDAFQTFKADLAEGSVANAYIFYGEESYLREFYLGELRKRLVPAGFEEFKQFHVLVQDIPGSFPDINLDFFFHVFSSYNINVP